MKKLIYLFIILFLASFKGIKTFTNSTNNYFTILIDNEQNSDSISIVKGLPININGIKCYWEYKIKKAKSAADKKSNYIILHQKLISLAHKETLFETNNEVDNVDHFYSFEDFKKHKTLNTTCNDIDKDGYCDFKIVIERAAAGANETCEVFLFNPKSKKFMLSKVFSGTNMEYDKQKNRISFMWKMGAREYSFGYINLKKNRRDVEFVENIDQVQDTVVYTKSIGKKIIKRKKVVLKREEWQGDEVSQGDSQYLLERNKK